MERRLAVHAGSNAEALNHRGARRAWLLALVVAAVAASVGTADAKPKRRDAKAAFDRGVTSYQKGNFEAAAEFLGKSFELERDVDTLFAWAQAERKLDRCDKAIELYDKLLTFNLPPANKTAVEGKLVECRTILAQSKPEPPPAPSIAALPPEPAATPSTPGVPAGDRLAPPPERPPVESPRTGHSWYTDPVALTLLGSGVVAGGAGTWLLMSAQSLGNDSKHATTYQETQDLKNQADQRGLIGPIAMVGGGVLVVSGVVWIVLHRDSGEQRTVTGWLTPGGGGLAITGPF